jgi:hypothetical protein
VAEQVVFIQMPEVQVDPVVEQRQTTRVPPGLQVHKMQLLDLALTEVREAPPAALHMLPAEAEVERD